jgi:predicted house-cleaning noncanonical NTP pyrophosphatase (MazG superfamily)
MARLLGAVKIYRKLVRDRIPDIIERAGKRPIYRRLGPEEYRSALRAKIVEEAEEVASASPESLLTELADLAETLDATLEAYQFTGEQLECARRQRNEERGGFSEKVFLERVEE